MCVLKPDFQILMHSTTYFSLTHPIWSGKWGSGNWSASQLLCRWSQGGTWEGLCSSGRLHFGEAHKDLTRSSHLLSTSCWPSAFRQERGRFFMFLKTKYTFYLRVERVNGIKGNSYHFLRIYFRGAVHALSSLILKSIPQWSHFPDDKTKTHRSS